jgi:hypothetical protein
MYNVQYMGMGMGGRAAAGLEPKSCVKMKTPEDAKKSFKHSSM